MGCLQVLLNPDVFGSSREGVNLLSFLDPFAFPQGFFGTDCIFQVILKNERKVLGSSKSSFASF